MNRFRMGSQTWTIVRKARSDILFFNKTPLFRYYRFRNQRQQMPLIAYGRQSVVLPAVRALMSSARLTKARIPSCILRATWYYSRPLCPKSLSQSQARRDGYFRAMSRSMGPMGVVMVRERTCLNPFFNIASAITP